MSRKLNIISFVLFLVAALCVGAMAQGRGQNQGRNGMLTGQANLITLNGVVSRIQMAPGQGSPSIALSLDGNREVTVLLGPYRLLAGKTLDFKDGSRISVQAIQSQRLENTFAAVQITNLDSGSTVVLRDSNGMPAWAGGGFGGNGAADCAGTGQPQLDVTAKTSLSGTVQSVNMGLGQGFPSFALAQADGKIVTIIVSPFRLLLDSNYKIAIGDQMSVVAYPSMQHEGAYVAAELSNHTNNNTVLKLRDDQGVPTGAGGGMGRGGCGACPRSL